MAMAARQMPTHPGLRKHREERARSLQNRIADAITTFSGSMLFVYVHIAWFSIWIGFKVEAYPFGLLTMIVSLEAIFLSTFVLISQNRQDQARGHMAEIEYALVRKEKEQNEELLKLSNEILRLARSIDELTKAHTGATPP